MICLFIIPFNNLYLIGDWGLGIGDWGLGIGDWAQSPIPKRKNKIILNNLILSIKKK